MVSNEQRRRQLAREKFERQQQRREAARRKARRRSAVIASGVALALAAGTAAVVAGALNDDDGSATAAPSPSAPAEPSMSIDRKATYTMSLKTDQGKITVAMDAAKTPHTVNSFKHLADKGFFNGTKCHRLSATNPFVLQCGDPEGTGMGGPGYTIPDENLGALGKPDPKRKTVKYRAGTVAMANTGAPDTGGSQFFIVYRDSELPPAYTPFGTIDKAGLQAVRKVAEGGLRPFDPKDPKNGAPKKAVTIAKATVAKG